MSTLFDELAEVDPEVAARLAGAEIRCLPPGTSHRRAPSAARRS